SHRSQSSDESIYDGLQYDGKDFTLNTSQSLTVPQATSPPTRQLAIPVSHASCLEDPARSRSHPELDLPTVDHLQECFGPQTHGRGAGQTPFM
ncbi:MAG: hypothetical protein Q9169_007941, partial [Polycauliona sp. 2 TL-2023]